MNYAGTFEFSHFGDNAQAETPAGVDLVPHAGTEAAGPTIVVQDANLLFSGDYKRAGVDLVLSKDGHEHTVSNYFKGAQRASLSSSDGATLSADLVKALVGEIEVAQLGGGANAAAQVIGSVTKLTGSATAIRNGVSVMLNVGDNVQKGDVVQAGADSSLGLTFIDGTVFGLSSNARMVLNEMVYDPNGSSNSSLLSLVQGTITFVAGETAKHGDMRVDTPVATMGIRGTAVLVEIGFEVPGQGTAPPVKFQVLVEPGGRVGSYVLYSKSTGQIIGTVNQAGQVTSVFGSGDLSTNPADPLSPLAQGIIQQTMQQFFPNYVPNANPRSNGSGGGSAPSDPNSGTAPDPLKFAPPSDPGIGQPFTVPINLPGDAPNTQPINVTITRFNSAPTITVAPVIVTLPVDKTSFKLGDQVVITDIDATNPAFNDDAVPYVPGSGRVISATGPGHGPSEAVLKSLVNVDAQTGAVSYDAAAFKYLAAGETAVFTIAFDSRSGPDTVHETISVTIQGVNDAPVIESATVAVAEGGTVVLSAANFVVNDPDSSQFTFKVAGVAHGKFQVAQDGIHWTDATSFTTAELDAGHVRFVHDGSQAAPAFSIQVDDGAAANNASNIVSGAVTFVNVNHAPVITSATLAVVQGGTTVVSLADIGITDPDSSSFTFYAAATHGTFERFDGQSWSAIPTGAPVTSADIAANLIRFHHDGSNFAPQIVVAVSDGQAASDPFTATVAFTPTHVDVAPALDLDTGLPGTDAAQQAFVEGGSPVALFGGAIAITDADNTALHSATVTLTSNGETSDYPNDHFTLSGTLVQGTTSFNGLTITYASGANGLVITATGDASAAVYEQFLQALGFTTSSTDTSDRTVSVVVNDGTADSNTATVTVTVTEAPTPVYDPTVTATTPENLIEATESNAGVFSSTANLTLHDTDGTASYDDAALLDAGWAYDEGTYTKIGQYGIVYLNTYDNTLTYVLNNTAADGLSSSDHPTETFTIPVTDGHATSTTSVIFTVDGADDGPASNVWTGAAGDQDWNNSDNWSLGIVPGNGQIVTIDAHAPPAIVFSLDGLDGPMEIAELHIGADAELDLIGTGTLNVGLLVNDGDIQLAPGVTLQVNGDVQNNGTLLVDDHTGGATLLIHDTVTVEGGGTVTLDGTADRITGDSLHAKLINADNTINGYGKLGDGKLSIVNQCDGKILASDHSHALVIDTGKGGLINFGLIASMAMGGLKIEGDLVNFGTIDAHVGRLEIDGNLTGHGIARIDGGTLEFGGWSDANVKFSGVSSDELVLDRGSHFTGTVSGLSSGDMIDLQGISPWQLRFYQHNGVVDVYYGWGSNDHFTLTDPGVLNHLDIDSDHHGGTEITWTNDAPEFDTSDVHLSKTDNNAYKISGLSISDSDWTSGDRYTLGITGHGNDIDTLSSINRDLDHGFTFTKTGDASQATVAVAITDQYGASDHVNFIFNTADIGGNSHVRLTGTNEKDVIFATTAQDKLTGNGGADQFVFAARSGGITNHDTITDFNPGQDKIELDHFKSVPNLSGPFSEFQLYLWERSGGIEQNGQDTLIHLDNHDTLLLTGVKMSQLHASDFIVHPYSGAA